MLGTIIIGATLELRYSLEKGLFITNNLRGK